MAPKGSFPQREKWSEHKTLKRGQKWQISRKDGPILPFFKPHQTDPIDSKSDVKLNKKETPVCVWTSWTTIRFNIQPAHNYAKELHAKIVRFPKASLHQSKPSFIITHLIESVYWTFACSRQQCGIMAKIFLYSWLLNSHWQLSHSPNLLMGWVTEYSAPSITMVPRFVFHHTTDPGDCGLWPEGARKQETFARTDWAIARQFVRPVDRMPPTVTQRLKDTDWQKMQQKWNHGFGNTILLALWYKWDSFTHLSGTASMM